VNKTKPENTFKTKTKENLSESKDEKPIVRHIEKMNMEKTPK